MFPWFQERKTTFFEDGISHESACYVKSRLITSITTTRRIKLFVTLQRHFTEDACEN